NDVNAVREMNNVDDFYEVLLRDFESNLNTLGDNDFSSPRAVSANIKEMADELLANGITNTLPQSINDCNGSQTCVDNVLAPVSEELLIDENESVTISNDETDKIKSLLVGKILYVTAYQQNIEDYLDKIVINSEGTSITGTTLEGSQKGEVETYTMSIENNRFITGDEYHIFVRESNDYIVFNDFNSDGTANGQSRLYFDETKAREYYESLKEDESSLATAVAVPEEAPTASPDTNVSDENSTTVENSSFTRDDEKEVVTDSDKGLMWQDDSEASSARNTWREQEAGLTVITSPMSSNGESSVTAFIYCSDLVLAEYTDWRLPSLAELTTLSSGENNGIQPNFQNVSSEAYWTSTEENENTAHIIDFDVENASSASYAANKDEIHHIRCVRTQ
ncbi:MAG: DUF1566 domain-containing protein, partial [Epsilonproteobacteria bacterium]|nr:DUF1566 domain-containing protein [Campylobacterota bacterium]